LDARGLRPRARIRRCDGRASLVARTGRVDRRSRGDRGGRFDAVRRAGHDGRAPATRSARDRHGGARMSVPTFDPGALTAVDNYLTSCCRDMGVTMMTTAYSPIFNESLDFSCVIFDPAGNMLAQAEFCPSQIGTIKFTVDWTIEELGLDAFEEGDVLLHNDPYRGSGH